MPVEKTAGGTTITGDAIGGFRGKVILSAIQLYLKTGMRANRAYTNANMVRAAGEFTRNTYPATKKGLSRAAAELEAMMAGKSLDEIGVVEKDIAKARAQD